MARERARRTGSAALAFCLACFLMGILGAGACASSTEPGCRVGADCASGACASDGRCVPVASGADASKDGATGVDDGGSTGDGSQADAPRADTGACGDGDGVITAAEVPLKAGLKGNFKVGTNATVDTAGIAQPDGSYAWDYSGAMANDHAAVFETQDPGGRWFSAKYPGASYVTRLSDTSDLFGVFQTGASLKLLGVASPDETATKTQVANDPAAEILAFPLSLGKTWSTTASVSGTLDGIVLLAPYSEKYESAADKKGKLKTPLGTFPVLRVKTTLTRVFGLQTTIVRSFAFITECYGNVATVRAKDNETQVEFTLAAEIARLAP